MQHQIWMIGWEYPPHNSGGLGVACQGLTESLADQNTRVYFSLPYHLDVTVSHMQVVPCLTAAADAGENNSGRRQPPFTAYMSSHTLAAGQPWQPVDRAALRRLPDDEVSYRVNSYAAAVVNTAQHAHYDYQLIHAHDWMSFPAAQTLQKTTHKPLVAHVHSTEFDRVPSGRGNDYIHAMEFDGLQAADHVIAVSEYTKKILIHNYGLPATKITVIHNGASPFVSTSATLARFAPHKPVIVFMGRLTSQKGPEYFIHLAKAVLAQRPEALFVVAGDGDLYQSLLLQTAQNQLTAHVLFSGFVRGPERQAILDRADIFVMPSVSEPFGLVAVEAIQRGAPVIVSKTAGVAEVIPSAIAIDFWDIAKLTTAICELLDKPQRRQQLWQQQKNEANRVSWERAAHAVRQVYDQLLGRT